MLASMTKTQASIDARQPTKKRTAIVKPTPSTPRPAAAAAPPAPPCGICGCTNFKPHQFKPKRCIECSHEHGTSQRSAAKSALMNLGKYEGPAGPKPAMAVKPWEREASEQRVRDEVDRAEVEAREKGRAEAKLSLSQRKHHSGRWVSWYKMVQGDGGFKRQKMGELWTCCGSADKGAVPCAGPAELSDLHAACSKCGTMFYPFELPSKCRSHSGLLEWRGLRNEEGCNEFFKHLE
eukprot:gene14585-6328_t